MKQTYSIHDLFNFTISGSKKALKYIERQFRYFKNSKVDNIHLEITVGPFKKPSMIDYVVVNRNYYVGNDSIYVKDSYKIISWEAWLENIDSDSMSLHFNGNYFSHMFLYKVFIEPIMRHILNRQGYTPVHSSCVGDGKVAYLFPASPNVGKTSTLLNWFRTGKEFISDEFTIIGNQKVLSYPTPFRLHDYNLKVSPYIKKRLRRYDLWQIYIRGIIYKLSLGYADITHEIDISDVFDNIKIPKERKLKKCYIFTKSHRRNVQFTNRSIKEITRKIVEINKVEMKQFNDYMAAYAYVYPNSLLANHWTMVAENTTNNLNNVDLAEIFLPSEYKINSFTQIEAFLK